jgi:hypothetical protein
MVCIMALDLDEQDGQTPLDPDEKAGLLPEHLATVECQSNARMSCFTGHLSSI